MNEELKNQAKADHYFGLWCDTRETIREMARCQGGARWDPFKLDVSRLDEYGNPPTQWIEEGTAYFPLRAIVISFHPRWEGDDDSRSIYTNTSYTDDVFFWDTMKRRDVSEGSWPEKCFDKEAPELGYWCSPLDLIRENQIVSAHGFRPAPGPHRTVEFDDDMALPLVVDKISLVDPKGSNGPVAIERFLDLEE